MTHISQQELNKKVWRRVYELFLEALVRAKNKSEAEIFVTGFLTPTERIMLSKRFAIFFLLEKGVTPIEIKDILKVSFATASRISLWRETLDKEQKRFINRILNRREFKNFVVDNVKAVYFGPIPPKGVDWKRWRREKERWRSEMRESLR